MLKAYTRVNTFLAPSDKDAALSDVATFTKDRHSPSASISDVTARTIASWYAEGNPNLALLAKGKKFRIPDLRDELLEGGLPSDQEWAMLQWLDLLEWMINPTHSNPQQVLPIPDAPA